MLQRSLSAAAAGALLAGLAAAPASADPDPNIYQVNAKIKDGATADAFLEELSYAIENVREIPALHMITFNIEGSLLNTGQWSTIAQGPGIEWAEIDHVVDADATDPSQPANDALLATNQVPGAQTWTRGSADITVAVVDTGVSPTPDLPAQRLAPGYDFVDDDNDPTDEDGHGTAIATIIAGEADNGVGGAGVCPRCTIMPIRVLGPDGATLASGAGKLGTGAEGYTSDVAQGIVWAADHGARIVNLSASSETIVFDASTQTFRSAVAYAQAKGVLIVASAGHAYQGETKRAYPAGIDSEVVLSVGSVSADGKPDSNTNYNTGRDPWIDVAAVDGLTVAGRAGKATVVAGTSASTAVVAGAAALELAQQPSRSAAQVRSDLIATANRVAGTPVYSTPILDASRALTDGAGAADTTPPVLVSTGLTNRQTIGAETAVTVTPQATDDHAVQRIEYRFWGPQYPVSATAYPWAKSVKFIAEENGIVPVYVRAVDYAGLSHEVRGEINFDTQKPDPSWQAPTPEQHVRGGSVWVDIFAAEEGGSITVNGVRLPGNGWSGSGRVTPTAQGMLNAVIRDKAGNTTKVSRHVVVDTAGPTARTVTPAVNTKVKGTFTSTVTGVWDATGPVLVQLYADGKYIGTDRTAPYSMKVPTGSRNGKVGLTWKLTDKLGNVRNVTRTVIADNKAPTVSITSAPANKAKVSGTVKVYAKASDASGIARVELVVNGKVVSKDTTAGYVLSVNVKQVSKTMKVQVRAYDKLGNVKYTTARTWTRK